MNNDLQSKWQLNGAALPKFIWALYMYVYTCNSLEVLQTVLTVYNTWCGCCGYVNSW